MLVMEKTKEPVAYADEEESSEEPAEDLDTLIREARGEEEKDEVSADNVQEANVS